MLPIEVLINSMLVGVGVMGVGTGIAKVAEIDRTIGGPVILVCGVVAGLSYAPILRSIPIDDEQEES